MPTLKNKTTGKTVKIVKSPVNKPLQKRDIKKAC